MLAMSFCVWAARGQNIVMSRLNWQVFYLWRHVLSTAPSFLIWWSNLEILFAPLHRSSHFIGGLCFQAIQTEHGPYIAERTQKAVYFVRCLWARTTSYNTVYTGSGSKTLIELSFVWLIFIYKEYAITSVWWGFYYQKYITDLVITVFHPAVPQNLR
jgi:hypothetical protein